MSVAAGSVVPARTDDRIDSTSIDPSVAIITRSASANSASNDLTDSYLMADLELQQGNFTYEAAGGDGQVYSSSTGNRFWSLGDGTFRVGESIELTERARRIKVADLNADGHADLLLGG